MSDNPCHHRCDWTDDDSDITDDAGCCSTYPIRRSCEAPTIPTPECDEEEPVVEYDPDTEEFSVTTIMYDNACSPWQDNDGDNWLATII